jgi:hypothetical protein
VNLCWYILSSKESLFSQRDGFLISTLDRSQISVKTSTFEERFTTEIPAANDTSRDPEYGLGTMASNPSTLNWYLVSGPPTVIGVYRCPQEFLSCHIFKFSESLHEVTNCIRFIFLSYKVSTMSCVQIVLENGDHHPTKANALFKKPYLSNVFLVAFWKVLWSAKSPSRMMRKIPWGKSIFSIALTDDQNSTPLVGQTVAMTPTFSFEKTVR